MTGFLSVLVAGGSALVAANATVGSNAGAGASASCSVDSAGTLTYTGNNSSGPPNWWALFGAVSGNNYWVSFHKTAGTTWTGGTAIDGTVYATSASKSVSWASAGSLVATVLVSFWDDAAGTIPIGTLTLNVALN